MAHQGRAREERRPKAWGLAVRASLGFSTGCQGPHAGVRRLWEAGDGAGVDAADVMEGGSTNEKLLTRNRAPPFWKQKRPGPSFHL